jgi:hypothetical protein
MDRGGEGTAGGWVTKALIAHLRFTIKKLRCEMFGPRSERQPFPVEGPTAGDRAKRSQSGRGRGEASLRYDQSGLAAVRP